MRAGTEALYHDVIARPSRRDIWPRRPANDGPPPYARCASWSRLGGAMAQTVCLCGSFRHWAEMLALREALLAGGAPCEWPTPELHRDPATMTGDEARTGHKEEGHRSLGAG